MLNRFLDRWKKDHEALRLAIINEDLKEIERRMTGKGCAAVTTVIFDDAHVAAVHFAAFQGSVSSVAAIANLGFPIDPTGIYENNFIYSGFRTGHFAAFKNQLSMLEYLAHLGVGLDKPKNDNEATPLHIAITHGSGDAMRFLVKNGSNINAEMSLGNTPLMLAVESDRAGCVRYLIENGADVNHRNAFRGSALTVALHNNSLGIAEILLDAGAKPRTRDIELAQESSRSGIKDLMDAYLIHRKLEEASSGITLFPVRSTLRM